MRALLILGALGVALLLSDLAVDRHGALDVEHWFGFYALWTFVASAALMLAGAAFARIAGREEDADDD